MYRYHVTVHFIRFGVLGYLPVCYIDAMLRCSGRVSTFLVCCTPTSPTTSGGTRKTRKAELRYFTVAPSPVPLAHADHALSALSGLSDVCDVCVVSAVTALSALSAVVLYCCSAFLL